MIIHKMNRVSGFIIIIITGALVRISEYISHHFRYSDQVAVYRGTIPRYAAVPRYEIVRGAQH